MESTNSSDSLQKHLPYPVVYRSSLSEWLFIILLTALICPVIFSVFRQAPIDPYFYILTLIVIYVIFYFIRRLSTKFTLHNDKIIESSFLGSNTLHIQDIKDYKIVWVKFNWYIHLIPEIDSLKVIIVPESYAQDEVFALWLKGLHNLKGERRATLLQEIQQWPTSEERKGRVATLNKFSTYLVLGFLFLIFWMFSHPYPVWLALFITLLPLIVIAVAWKVSRSNK